MSQVIELSKALINLPSITPDDKGCQDLLINELKQAGFTITQLPSGEVKNLYASHGSGEPSLLFIGHTDVVPPGPSDAWNTDPFAATEKDGYLYGRGAADMKAAVAAMTLAATSFVQQNPNHTGTIGLVITSDEEGPATDGTIKVVEYLEQNNLLPNYVIVGEASSNKTVGDAIKIGRRGSMHGELTILGKQGHIAYPDKADNPIHRCFKALDKLAQLAWDRGNDYFAPTSFQIYDIQSGVGAANVIPGTLTAKFNFRFAPTSTPEMLQNKIARILKEYKLKYELNFHISSQPYLSGQCDLSNICCQAIQDICQIECQPNTLGGTSDGRHFAPHGCQVVELGAVNASIHKANENIHMEELKQLEKIYYRILELTK